MSSVIALALIACVVLVSVVGVVAWIASLLPDSARAAEGNWDFSVTGCLAWCSKYRVGYEFPPSMNTSSVAHYHLNFTVIRVDGTTAAVQLKRLNLTISTDGGTILYLNSYQ